MKLSGLRRAGLAACIALTFLSGTAVVTPVSAQINLGNFGGLGGSSTNGIGGMGNVAGGIGSGSISNYANLATSGLSAINNGGSSSIPNVASFLNSNSANPSTANQSAIGGALGNLFQNGNVNPQSAVGLIGGMMSGNISGGLGQALSGVQGLGNINSVSGLNSVLSNPNVMSSINSLPIGQQAGALQSVMSAAGGSNLLSSISGNSGALGSVTNTISQNFPGASQALGAIGGAGGLQGAVGNMASQALQAMGLSGAAAGLIGGAAGGLLGGLLGGGGKSGGGAQGCTTGGCCQECGQKIPQHYQAVRDHVTEEFSKHRTWFLTTYWKENFLPALMLMAQQLTVAGIKQVEMIGELLDAKHQMETQRVMQQLMAEAHKDYQPSEGVCTFGSVAKSLAASERKSNAAQLVFSQRMLQRQAMIGQVTSLESADSDLRSRLDKFRTTYCDPADNAKGLAKLCPRAGDGKRRNIDVDYTRNVESRLTLDLGFADTTSSSTKPDEEDVFALSANLFAHNIAPRINPELLATADGRIRVSAVEKYLDLRAIYAKRSVAQNSFAAMTSMRASGDTESSPYTKRLIYELGVTDTKDIDKILGEKPSYFAQMEVLTKKLYQNPVFYTELYDKPANVERKAAAMQAIGLMQDRDLYNSLLRSEAVMSVLLETMLEREQTKVINAQRKLNAAGGAR